MTHAPIFLMASDDFYLHYMNTCFITVSDYSLLRFIMTMLLHLRYWHITLSPLTECSLY